MKSYWLDGKRNRRIDHMIYTLIQRMLPEKYHHQHQRQDKGFEGDDLAKRHESGVLARALTVSANSITALGDAKFQVASQSILGRNYVVDTRAAICNCLDFPRIRLCKHLAAVQSQHPHILKSQNPQTNEFIPAQNLSQAPSQVASSSLLVVEELPHHHPSISESGTRSEALPKRDRLSPNRNLWLETSSNMHVRISPKRRQRSAASILPSSTAQHIGATGKRKLNVYTDPYSGGEQLGKRAKPDAVSVVTNVRARSLAPSQGQISQ